MKKLLSAVLAILMIASAATFTGSVFAAAYTYTSPNGEPVVYVSSTGTLPASAAATESTDSTKAYSNLNAAFNALFSTGGYIIVVDDIDIGKSFKFTKSDGQFYTNKITIRGRDDVAEKVQITTRHMTAGYGPLSFENIRLMWDTGESANDHSIDMRGNTDGNNYKATNPIIIGEGVEFAEGSQELCITGNDITLNSSTATVSTRLSETSQSSTYNFPVNITLNDGTLTGISGNNTQTATTTVNGDLNLNFNGGTFGGAGITVAGRLIVDGDYTVTVKGDTVFTSTDAAGLAPVKWHSRAAFESSDAGFVPSSYTITGVAAIDALEYTGSTLKINESAWDAIYINPIEVSDTLVLTNDTISATAATYVGTTENAKVVINGDVSLKSAISFKNVTIVNGENGRIIANGKKLAIAEDVDTAANETTGKYIDIVTGSVDGSAVKASAVIENGIYNSIVNNGTPDSKLVLGNAVSTIINDYKMNALQIAAGASANMDVSLSDFTDNMQVGKYSPAESANFVRYTTGQSINSDILSYIRVEYFLNTEEGDTLSATPYVMVNGGKVEAQSALASGWNVMNFDISGNGSFTSFDLYPYGDATDVAEHNKMYVSAITLSLINDTSAVTYSNPKWMGGNGDFVPDVDDFTMYSQALVNTSDREPVGLGVDAAPFTNGMAAKISPLAGSTDVMLRYTLTDENGDYKTLRADFIPYVRIEYFLSAKDAESFAGVYPRIMIPGAPAPFVAEQPLAAGWNVATFNIYDAEAQFPGFFYYPYGSATVNEWNKMYIASVTFSQTENKSAPVYGTPDINKETGDVNPYIFDPSTLTNIPDQYAYLKDMPVVYYSNTGVYAGDAAGSTSSLASYGDINKAIAALEAVGGGYIILTTDLAMNGYGPTNQYNPSGLATQNNSITSHSNMIILRGMDAEKTTSGEKVTIGVGSVINFNGPVWLQNAYFESVGTNDEGLVSEELHYGTPGAGDDDVVSRNGTWQTKTTGLGIGSSVSAGKPKKVDVTIHSGTFKGTLKAGGYYSGMTNSGNMYITIEGGDLREMTWGTTHQNTHSTAGSAYINISGGKFKKAISFAGVRDTMNSPCYIMGDLTVKITGGDFSEMAANALYADKFVDGVSDGVHGTRTIDILDYTGSSYDKLRAAIDITGFDVLNINAIYLDEVNGNDSNTGLSSTAPVKTLAKALSLVSYEEGGKKYGGKIVLTGAGYTVDAEEAETAHTANVSYTSEGGKLYLGAPFVLSGPATFQNIEIEAIDDGAAIFANGNTLVMGSGVNVTGGLDIIGGVASGEVASVDVTINSGTYRNVSAGDSVAGGVSITINDGDFTGNVVGGSITENGVIGGSIRIAVNGGDFARGTIIATGVSNTSAVNGSAEINITGGDFADINQIQPGNSATVGKISVDYQNYSGDIETLKSKISSTFDVTVGPKMDAPVFTKGDKFIFIIKHTGDPTKALTKKIPFKITQSAEQSANPVVVSPAQLNLKVNNADHAIMTLQQVNGVDTIRFVPNPNFTTGSRIVVDGYNIKGRGVNSGKHKYAEIIYYYTVPEGHTPAASKMSMNFYGNHTAVGTHYSTELVANKWSTAIIDLTAGFAKVDPAEVTQYHFSPLCNSSGAALTGKTLPAGQYMDIVSLTFYSDMPKTSVTGGNSPASDIPEEEEEEEAAKPVDLPDIKVKLSQIMGAVNGVDSFAASEKMFDGQTAVEYIPNRSYSDAMSIEGYGTTGGTISSMDYQYVILKMYLKSEAGTKFKPVVATQIGGVADDPNRVASTSYSVESELEPNQWHTVAIKITPKDSAQRNFRQIHIRPFGSTTVANLAEGDIVYIAELTYSTKAPKVEKPADSEDKEEVVEEEAEIIAESPAVVVAPEKLISSGADVKTFKSTVGEFDGKKVVMIKAAKVDAPVTIDGAAIFGETEQTPGGALSLEKHRYAVISYYYATSEAETTRAPEFDLLGGRIQNMENVINGVTATGTELKVNQWATAVVKLTGNGDGVLTSGFNLRPFGDTSARNISSDDVLYIENITFVSNRPQ